MATRNRLRDKIQVLTIGQFLAEVDEVWRGEQSWLGGSIQLPDSPFGRRCLWNAMGVCNLELPEADIDMAAPIGHVLRWHLNNHG